MRSLIRLIWVAAALLLGACDVQLRDTTAAQFPANHDLGMYEVSASVTRGAMVSPGAVFVFALGDGQKVTLTPNADGTEWRGMYAARCRGSFPLQFLAEWRLPLGVRHKLVPPAPRQIGLTEPPLTPAVSFEAAGKTPPKGGWQGSVQYRFVTVPSVHITAAHIEPSTAEPADVSAAKSVTILTALPLVAGCGDLAELRLASSAPRAHGILVIDTDDPGASHWQTRVEFAPP